MENFRRRHGARFPNVSLVANAAEALKGADILVVMTEWNEFRNPDFAALSRELRLRAVFDARNLYRSADLGSFGLQHFGIGLRPGSGGNKT
jgi:UDPglucose 6-dehydrogenase